MTSRILIFVSVFLACLPATCFPADAESPAEKRAVAASRLVLPFFEVDVANPAGASALFSVRNESLMTVDVRYSFYEPDRPGSPFHSEIVPLAGKAVRSVDVRRQPNLLAGADGFARGFAIAETVGGETVLQGDYFQITPNQAFANGSRLVNAGSTEDSDLCSVFTIRFLNGGGFDGGTTITFWLDLDVAPQGENVLTYTVYDEAGNEIFFQSTFPALEAAFQRTAAELTLPIPTNFGALEIELLNGVRGHVSAVMSALGLYSVGLEASCGG